MSNIYLILRQTEHRSHLFLWADCCLIKVFVSLYKLHVCSKQNFPNVRFMICGDCDVSNPESLTPSDVEQLNSVYGIECVGYVENIWLYASLLASVLVLPSYREGFPKTRTGGNGMRTACDCDRCSWVSASGY